MGIAAAYIHPNPSSINKDHFFGKIHRPLQLDFGQDFALKSLPRLNLGQDDSECKCRRRGVDLPRDNFIGFG